MSVVQEHQTKNMDFTSTFLCALWHFFRLIGMIIVGGVVTVAFTLVAIVAVVGRLVYNLVAYHLMCTQNPPTTPVTRLQEPKHEGEYDPHPWGKKPLHAGDYEPRAPCAICFASKHHSGPALSVCVQCGNTFHTNCIARAAQHGHSACPCCRSTQGFVPLRW